MTPKLLGTLICTVLTKLTLKTLNIYILTLLFGSQLCRHYCVRFCLIFGATSNACQIVLLHLHERHVPLCSARIMTTHGSPRCPHQRLQKVCAALWTWQCLIFTGWDAIIVRDTTTASYELWHSACWLLGFLYEINRISALYERPRHP